MKDRVNIALALLVILLFTWTSYAFAEVVINSTATTGEGKIYTFTDRFGNEIKASANAFATDVISFVHGNPWTDHVENHNPRIALGIPDYTEEGSCSTGDLCLGGSGELILKLDVYVYDGPGSDLCIFERGPDIESTRIAISNDLEMWYDVGICPGSVASIDIAGKAPENVSFHYIKLTDIRDAASGDYPGADIDAVCALNYTTKPISTPPTPVYEPTEPTDSGEDYAFSDRYGNPLKANTNAFATKVFSFVEGYPCSEYDENRNPQISLGKPNWVDGSPTSTGDLTLGAGGVLVLGLDVYIKDGEGPDLCIFEVGDSRESSKIELSNDLKTWYTVGISSYGIEGFDIAGKTPANASFQFIKFTDLNDSTGGDWPGTDIDAVCALNYTTKPLKGTYEIIPTMPVASYAGKVYPFKDRNGDQKRTRTAAFATEIISFVPGYPWAEYSENRKTQNVLGVPDYVNGSPTSTGDLTLGASGVLVLRLDVCLCDGSGDDLCIFETGNDRESVKIEVSSDLKQWYSVGISHSGTEGFDIAGKTPANSSYRYVRITDLRDSTSGNWPGADIDAVCALNFLTTAPEMDNPDFILPDGLIAIQDEAFKGCAASVVSIPDGVSSIGDQAFADCANLKQIYIPATVKTIGKDAFKNDEGLIIFGANQSDIQIYAEQAGIAFVEIE